MKDFKQFFIDSNEKQIAVLGESYLQNFLNSGDLSKGFCAVSDKRAYFKGKCYYRSGNSFKSTSEEKVVDLKDITGTGFALINPISYLVISIVSLVLGMFFMTVNGTARFLGILLMLCAIGIGIFYFISKIKVFEITYSGGSMAFKTGNYTTAEIQKFQKLLRIAKDTTPTKGNVVMTSNSSIGDELKKYKELLDAGAISQEEYEQLKRKSIIN